MLEHIRIWRGDVFWVLGAFFVHGNERAFQINAAKPCGRSRFPGIAVFFCVCANMNQILFGEGHGSGADGSHAAFQFIFRYGSDRFLRAVTEIMSYAAVEMDVHKSRNQITAAAVNYFGIRSGVCNAFPFHIDVFCSKFTVICEYKSVFDNHALSLHFAFLFQING